MRVAYFVQSHRQPAQALRLLATLRAGSPGAVLVSGHCPTAPALDAARLAALGVLAFRHRRQGHRGYWSVLEPYLDAIAMLGDRGIQYDWLVYLSAADYPLQPLSRSEAELAASAVDGYLGFQPLSSPGPEGRRRQSLLRYGYHYVDLPRLRPLLRLLRPLNGVQRRWHVHLTYGPRLGWRTTSPAGWKLYRGLVWCTLRRAAAERVLEATRTEATLVEHLEHTICPEEAFLQTVLVADARFRLANDDLRFADFRGSRDGHPRALTVADLPALRASGKPFGRKFDPQVDASVLDALDRAIAAGADDAPVSAGPSPA